MIFFFRLSYLETSAATGQNIHNAVELLLDKVMARMDRAVEDAFGSSQRGKTVEIDVIKFIIYL